MINTECSISKLTDGVSRSQHSQKRTLQIRTSQPAYLETVSKTWHCFLKFPQEIRRRRATNPSASVKPAQTRGVRRRRQQVSPPQAAQGQEDAEDTDEEEEEGEEELR